MQFTIEEVEQRLNEFTSADEIAAQCAILGIRGKVGPESLGCPLAQVTGYQVGFNHFNTLPDEIWNAGDLPKAARNFVRLYTHSSDPQDELEARYRFLRPGQS